MHNSYIKVLFIVLFFKGFLCFFWDFCLFIIHGNFHISIRLHLVSICIYESNIVSKETCDIVSFVFSFFIQLFLCVIILIIQFFSFCFFFITHGISDFLFDDRSNRKCCTFRNITGFNSIDCYLYIIIFISKLLNRLCLFCCRLFSRCLNCRSFCLRLLLFRLLLLLLLLFRLLLLLLLLL